MRKAIILTIPICLLLSLAVSGIAAARTDIQFEGNNGSVEITTLTDQVYDDFTVSSTGDFMGQVTSYSTAGYHGTRTYMDRNASFGSRISGASDADGNINGYTISIQNEWGSSEDDGLLQINLDSDTGGYYKEQNLGRATTKMGFIPGGLGGWMNPQLIADGEFEIDVSAERYNNLAGGGTYDPTYESGSDLTLEGEAGGYVSTFASVGEQNSCHSVQFGNKYMGAGCGEGWHYDLLQAGTIGEGEGSFEMNSEEVTASYGSPNIDVDVSGTLDDGHEEETQISAEVHTSTGLLSQVYEFLYNFFLSGYADTN